MTEMIELPLGQSAQPGKCGSCFFFGRRADVPSYMNDVAYKYNQGGYCKLELPPQYARREQGEGSPTNWIDDTGSCDLWRASGKTFIEKYVVAT